MSVLHKQAWPKVAAVSACEVVSCGHSLGEAGHTDSGGKGLLAGKLAQCPSSSAGLQTACSVAAPMLVEGVQLRLNRCAG